MSREPIGRTVSPFDIQVALPSQGPFGLGGESGGKKRFSICHVLAFPGGALIAAITCTSDGNELRLRGCHKTKLGVREISKKIGKILTLDSS